MMVNLKRALLFFAVIFLAVNPFILQAAPEAVAEGSSSRKSEIDAYSEHHLKDDHYFSLFSHKESGKHYGFPLPVILIDNGLKVFSSGEFHHGESIVEKDGQYYVLFHGKIYKTDALGTLEGYKYKKDENGQYVTEKNEKGKDVKVEEALSYIYNSHELHTDTDFHAANAKPLDFSITKNVVGLLIAALLLVWGFTSLAKTYVKGSSNIPKGFARVLEPLVIYVRDEVARPNIGHRYKEFMPYLLTVFFLIWTLNLIGLTPIGFNVTGNIAVTLCLALFTFFITNIKANKDYWKHIFWMPGVPVPFKIVLAPIEVLGMFTKPFSLMLRLFANITAGHAVIMGLVAIIFLYQEQLTIPGSIGVSMVLSLILFFLELLVAFLQAFIFTMLSSLFIGMAVEEHSHH